MRVRRRRLLVPAAVLIGLVITTAPPASAADGEGAPAGSAANTANTQRLTGTVQTLIRERPRRNHREANKPDSNKPDTNDADDTFKVLRVGTKIVPLTDGSLATVKNGATVTVTVAPAVGGEQQVLAATTLPAATAPATTPSTHQVYVAVVRPAGMAADASITDSTVRAMVSTVSGYWSSQTGGAISFATAQVLVYTSAYGCSDPSNTTDMWAEAHTRMPSATGAGNHLVVVAPSGADNSGCDYGLGSIGSLSATRNEVFVSGLNQSLMAHELGHNLGLYHSNSLRCGTAQDKPKVGTTFPGCTASGYDDLFDVMGFSGSSYGEGNLNAVHLDGMNLLPNAVRKIAANSGATTVQIAPLSGALSGTTTNRTLKVTDPNGANYFVEYRTNSGRDTMASSNYYHPAWGVRVLRDDPNAPASAGSYELDATPTTATNDYNRIIPVGSTFTAASGNLTIRVTAADTASATIYVTSGTVTTPPPAPSPGSPVPASLTMSMPTSASVGALVTSTTVVTALNGAPVPGWTATLQKMQKGTSTWTWVASQPTSSTGVASARFTNGLSGYYRWVTVPATGAPSRYSPPAAVTSIARPLERAPVTSMTHGTYLSVSGSVPSVPAPVVYLQYRYTGDIWRTGPRATVSGTAVSVRMAVTRTGVFATRLYVATGSAYTGSFSPYYNTVVR